MVEIALPPRYHLTVDTANGFTACDTHSPAIHGDFAFRTLRHRDFELHIVGFVYQASGWTVQNSDGFGLMILMKMFSVGKKLKERIPAFFEGSN
jgi:hypothetical protein